jgi:hypothetical protein
MIPLDLEDVFGAAVVDAFRRGLAFFGCLLLASAISGLALGVGEALPHMRWRYFDGLGEALWMWWMPLPSLWGFIYVPLVVVSGFRFFTAESLLPEPFFRFLAAESVLMLVAVPDWEWERAVALFVLVGCLAAVRHLVLIFSNWRRRRFEEQLMVLAIENREARERLRREFGTDVPEPDDER